MLNRQTPLKNGFPTFNNNNSLQNNGAEILKSIPFN